MLAGIHNLVKVFKSIHMAYEVLPNEIARARYDTMLKFQKLEAIHRGGDGPITLNLLREYIEGSKCKRTGTKRLI